VRHVRFWISALLAATVFAAAAAWLFPYGLLRMEAEAEAERYRAWLLILWTAGVMGICFGATGLFSSALPLGFRDVAEAGSVSAAREARRRDSAASPFYNFAGWAVTSGGFLLIIYLIAWLIGP
jgi:hypothetical protein